MGGPFLLASQKRVGMGLPVLLQFELWVPSTELAMESEVGELALNWPLKAPSNRHAK